MVLAGPETIACASVQLTLTQMMEAGAILQSASKGEAEDAHKALAGLL